MKYVIAHLLIFVVGAFLLGLVLVMEFEGASRFLFATLGLILIIIGSTFENSIKRFVDFLAKDNK